MTKIFTNGGRRGKADHCMGGKSRPTLAPTSHVYKETKQIARY
jgi:hypothetical protein